jgi:hypothetical protein
MRLARFSRLGGIGSLLSPLIGSRPCNLFPESLGHTLTETRSTAAWLMDPVRTKGLARSQKRERVSNRNET